jgi:hypothetical protein
MAAFAGASFLSVYFPIQKALPPARDAIGKQPKCKNSSRKAYFHFTV